jgi:2-oxoisovalerate dehydrogenase E2 component (dihydrolipoyl transacylase)
MPDFLLPDLGEGLEEAEIIAWHVQVGDHVDVDQPIVEVETAKAAVEVPVPFAGAVAKIHAAPGAVVAVGQPLITIAADEPAAGFREPGAVTPQPAAAGAVTPQPATADVGAAESSGNVLIGYGTAAPSRGSARAARRSRRAARPVPATASVPAPSRHGSAAASAPAPGRHGPVAVISPLVRKIARDAGLDLTGVTGTGPSGLVRREDVRRALTQPAGPKPATAAAATAPPGEKRIPLRGARRTAADKLSRSRREIPEATVWVDVDATGLLEARRALNANAPQQPVSLLALVARFALLGLRQYPELGARIDADEIVIPGHVHLGFAAQTGHGLVVPVVHDAHRLSTRELSAALTARTAAARDGRLTPADLTGGTFTVNNYGVFGVDGSAAIINYPEVAILGIGRIIDRPWVVDGQVLVRKVGELTLAFDHRVCDGGTAGGFLRYVADCVESPVAALGDL